jgi:hypothetical protein
MGSWRQIAMKVKTKARDDVKCKQCALADEQSTASKPFLTRCTMHAASINDGNNRSLTQPQ